MEPYYPIYGLRIGMLYVAEKLHKAQARGRGGRAMMTEERLVSMVRGR
jgi:hypothetical protein